MTKKISRIKPVTLTLLLMLCRNGHADITLDGSLGPAGSLEPAGGINYQIFQDYGQTVGGNLFHSFGRFNIDLGQAATFYGSSAIDNVFARVTGGTPSSIDGLLTSAIPGANLWLINPSGVLFGPHASVNVNGSFYVSTADYLKFADGAVFESRLTPAPVLTAAAPEAFGFLGDNPAGITFEGSGSFAAETYLGAKMAVSEGNSLSVVGGDITLTQGKFYGVLDTETRLQAPGGQINLVSISSPGEVSVLDKGMPELSEGIGLGRITIDKGSQVLVNEATNTGIYIKGGEIVIDGAYIFATNFTANDPQPSGDIVIEADNLTLSNEALIAYANGTIAPNGIPLWGQGNNGDIQLSAAKQIALSGNSVIFNNTLGDGNGGSIGISSPSLAIDSSFIQARTIGNGDVGNVDITVDDLLATNGTISAQSGAFVGTNLLAGLGNGGIIRLNASNSVSMSGRDTGLFSNTFGDGDAGQIQVTTSSLVLKNAAQIGANTFFGKGKGGIMTLNVDTLDLGSGAEIISGSGAIYPDGTSVPGSGLGEGGAIEINAHEIRLSGPNAEGFIPTGVFNNAFGTGNAGTVTISTDQLSIEKGASIGTATLGGGNGGNISITANDAISLNQSGNITTDTLGSSRGGDIAITALNSVNLTGNALISAKSTGSGKAGDILVNAGERLTSQGSSITAEALQSDGGNITVNAKNRIYLTDSAISTSVGGGNGEGGNIRIDPVFVILDHSRIVANAFGGPGGNIQIVADHFIASPDSLVDASSQSGVDGQVVITSPDTNMIGKIATLTANFLDPSALFKEQCAARYVSGQSSLAVQIYNHFEPAPGDGFFAASYLPGEHDTTPNGSPSSPCSEKKR